MPTDLLDYLFGIDVPDNVDSIVSVLALIVAIHAADALIRKAIHRRRIARERGDGR